MENRLVIDSEKGVTNSGTHSTANENNQAAPTTKKMKHSFSFYSGTFKELSEIIRRGNIQSLRNALIALDVQLTGMDGTTILHVAATTNNPEVVKELLRHQRLLHLLDRQDWSGMTALMAAVRSNCPLTAEVLCRSGADLTKTMVKSGETALHLACHLPSNAIAQILLNYKTSFAFINQMDSSGDTALSQTVQYGSPIFDNLIEIGANILIQNPDNKRTLLHLTVAYNRKSMLEKMLQNLEVNEEFAELKDVKGDTALMIAVKLDRLDFIDLLTKHFGKLTGINLIENNSVLHIAISHNRFDILRHLLLFTPPDTIEFCDSDLRTPVMYAAELDRVECFKQLVEYRANTHVKNLKTGESLLHIIAKNRSNACLPLAMNLHHTSWLFVQKDYGGNTPYMTAIISGNNIFLHETFKVKKVDFTEFNYEGETATFYAIKQGYLDVLITLMLSPKYYEFAHNNNNILNLKDSNVILQAEIRGDIYATDVYILLGEVVDPLISYFPSNLLIRTKSGKTVFHACALGGSLECLKLLFDFYQLFAPKSSIKDFDSPDESGITPLLLAAQCTRAYEACIFFFVTHGSNLATTAEDGLSVINALSYNPGVIELFTKLLDQCVSSKKEYYYSERPNINVDFRMLCAKRKNQTAVVAMLFKYVKGPERLKILQHPVIVMFLRKKASTIKYLLLFRFISSIMVALITSILIPILYVEGHPSEERFGSIIATLMKITFLFIILLCILNTITKLPLLINRKMWFTDYVTIVPPISLLALLISGRSFTFTAELAATVILSSWMSVLVFGVNMYSNFTYQIAVYFGLIENISKRLVFLTLTIFTFSLCLYCIYHKDKRFKNISSCFIYAFTVMFPGYLSHLPTFSKDYFQNTTNKFHFCVECFILGCFVISMIGCTNMLVDIAIKSHQALEIDGQIFQHNYVIHYITELELFFTSQLYYRLARVYKLKCIDRIKQKMTITCIQNVYDQQNKVIYDSLTIQQFRNIVSKNSVQTGK